MSEKSEEGRLGLIAARVAGVGLTIARKSKKTKKRSKKTKKKVPVSKRPVRKKKTVKKVKKLRVSKPKETDITRASTEYSCRADMTVSMDFEGNVPKQKLMQAFENQIRESMQTAATIISRGFQLNLNGIQIGPISVDCAIVDSMGSEEFPE